MIPERYITEWSEQAPWVVNNKAGDGLRTIKFLSLYSINTRQLCWKQREN